MKKPYMLGVVLFLLVFVFSGCELFMGEDGEAFLKVTLDDPSSIEAWFASVEGFQDGWELDTNYELKKGDHAVSYVLWYHLYYSTSSEPYKYYFNSAPGWYLWYNYERSLADAFVDFAESEIAAVCTLSVTVDIEEGELFQDGDNTYYTLSLAWDPLDTTVSSRGIVLEKTVTTDGDSKILQFTDGYRTFTITVPDKASAPTGDLQPLAGVTQLR